MYFTSTFIVSILSKRSGSIFPAADPGLVKQRVKNRVKRPLQNYPDSILTFFQTYREQRRSESIRVESTISKSERRSIQLSYLVGTCMHGLAHWKWKQALFGRT